MLKVMQAKEDLRVSLVKSEKTELMEKTAKMVTQVAMESLVAGENLVQTDTMVLVTLVMMEHVEKLAILVSQVIRVKMVKTELMA